MLCVNFEPGECFLKRISYIHVCLRCLNYGYLETLAQICINYSQQNVELHVVDSYLIPITLMSEYVA